MARAMWSLSPGWTWGEKSLRKGLDACRCSVSLRAGREGNTLSLINTPRVLVSISVTIGLSSNPSQTVPPRACRLTFLNSSTYCEPNIYTYQPIGGHSYSSHHCPHPTSVSASHVCMDECCPCVYGGVLPMCAWMWDHALYLQ